MAENRYQFKILTPVGVKFNGEILRAEVRTPEGYIALMANNAPLVATAAPHVIYITHLDGRREAGIVDQATIYATRKIAKVFSLDFIWAKDVDVQAAKIAKQKLEARIKELTNHQEISAIELKLQYELLKLRESNHK